MMQEYQISTTENELSKLRMMMTEEVAEFLNRPVNFIHQMANRGEIPARKIGGR